MLLLCRCAYFSGGEYVVTGSQNKLARLWDAKTGKIIRTLPGHAGGIEAVYVFVRARARVRRCVWRVPICVYLPPSVHVVCLS